MSRVFATLMLAYTLSWPRTAEARHRPRATCVPVYIEGAGTVRICALARGR